MTIYDTYPWLVEMGFDDVIDDLLAEDIENAALILEEIRKSQRYQEMFPEIRRDDLTMRMSEREYLEQMDDYRDLLGDYGIDTSGYSTGDLAQFMVNEIAPPELEDRLRVYSEIRRSGREIRDAFYVYGGIRISDDDLYSYVVDPNKRVELDDQYAQGVAISRLDYDTFIDRATEVGLEAVTAAFGELEEASPGMVGERIEPIDPGFARQYTDLLYRGGTEGGLLNLEQLTSAFELAMIGSAATRQGLELPTEERVEAFRQAGINRQAALQQYGVYATQRNLIEGQVQRLNMGTSRFTQADFEEAVFIGSAQQADLLARAQSREESLGRAAGTAAFTAREGRLRQTGFASPLT